MYTYIYIDKQLSDQKMQAYFPNDVQTHPYHKFAPRGDGGDGDPGVDF